MAHYVAIWKFLATHRGYYFEGCLAEQLNLSADDVSRILRHRADVALRYAICQTCLLRRVSSAYDEAPDVRPLECECDEVLTFRPNPSAAQTEEVTRLRRTGSKRGAYEQAAMLRDADAMTLLRRTVPPGGSGSARRREEVALEPPWPWREGGVDG